MKQKAFTTYAIRDPRNGLFVYVGQTNQYKKRQQKHCTTTRRVRIRGTNIKTWMYDTITAGIEPEFVVLETTFSKEDSLVSECRWIKKFAEEKHPLLNKWKIHKTIIKSVINGEDCPIPIQEIKTYLETRKFSGQERHEPKPKNTPTTNRQGKPWQPHEDEQLKKLYSEGKNGEEIASLLYRPFKGICARLVRLGVIPNRKSIRP